MSDKTLNVLFLCTGNSARSIVAECVLNRLGQGRFKAYSAGSHPAGEVHPVALRLLERQGYSIDALRSKSWDEFEQRDAPPMDFIFTVCDNAAHETCPLWLGHPVSAHWGLTDPAAVQGSDADKDAAFKATHRMLLERIKSFVALPFETLDEHHLRRQLDAIGCRDDGPATVAERSA